MVKRVLEKLKVPMMVLFLLVVAVSIAVMMQPQKFRQNVLELQHKTQSQPGVVGAVNSDFDPSNFLTAWNFNDLEKTERMKYYKETLLADRTLLREYWIYAEDKEIEIAPGIFFPAWTYNGQVPGPTIRATEGDSIKIHFQNRGTKPHTMHFHGYHAADMDGSMPEQTVLPGDSFTYEFKAEPFGIHLYHCHGFPVSQHIHKGLYGMYVVDPKPSKDTRPKPDKELVMIMNGFDTNFDRENEVYAVNTIAFYYHNNPIKVKKNELVRIYLANMVEFDPINSFHLHANFFDEYKTGTSLIPNEFTDIISFVQGERSVIDVRFKQSGNYMFHAHQSEFAEKGWAGMFEVIDNYNDQQYETTQNQQDNMGNH